MDNSEDHKIVVIILSFGTQLQKLSNKAWTAACPSFESSPPIKTLSCTYKSAITEPSARNSGFESTWNFTPFCFEYKIVLISLTIRIGKVDFSTTILSVSDS